jgi:hypothetical protein
LAVSVNDVRAHSPEAQHLIPQPGKLSQLAGSSTGSLQFPQLYAVAQQLGSDTPSKRVARRDYCHHVTRCYKHGSQLTYMLLYASVCSHLRNVTEQFQLILAVGG